MDKNVFYFRKMTIDIYYDRVRRMVDLTSLVDSAIRSEIDFPELSTDGAVGEKIDGKLWVSVEEMEKSISGLNYYIIRSIKDKIIDYDKGTDNYIAKRGDK